MSAARRQLPTSDEVLAWLNEHVWRADGADVAAQAGAAGVVWAGLSVHRFNVVHHFRGAHFIAHASVAKVNPTGFHAVTLEPINPEDHP